MLRLIKVLFVLIVILVVAVIALPFLIPPSVIKAQIETFASDALDRQVTIDGELDLKIWPPLSASVEGVRLANADGLEPPSMVQVERLDLVVDALAYLEGVVKIDRLVVSGPQIDIHIDENGLGNWPVAESSGGASGGDRSGRGSDGAGIELPRISLGEIRIEDGRFGLVDRSADLERQFKDIQLSLAQNGTNGPIAIEGQIVQAGDMAVLSGEVADPLALAQGGSSELNLNLELPGGRTAVAGTIDGGAQSVDLALALNLDNPRRLADWAGAPLKAPEGLLQIVELKSQIAGSAKQVRIGGLSLKVDDIEADGDLTIDLGTRPKIAGAVNFGALDLDALLPPPVEGEEVNETSAPASEETAQGWPDDPIELPLPLPVDIDLALGWQALTVQGLEVGQTGLTIQADPGSNRLGIGEMALYEGNVTGSVALSPGEQISVTSDIQALGIQIHPILLAFAELDMLEGKGNVELNLQTAGNSVKDFVEGLNGDGAVLLRDGAIIGLNIGAIMRSVLTLGVNAEAREAQRTDFAEFGGSFTIQDGIVQNDDLALKAPTLRVDGAGTVDLPAQAVDYRLRPAIAGTLQGQDATGDEAFKTGVPIAIVGPWADPDIQIEIDGVLTGDLTDPAALAATLGALAGDSDRLNALRDQLGLEGEGGLAGAVGNLVGGDGAEGDAVGEALGNLLNSGEGADGDASPQDAAKDAVGAAIGTLLGGVGGSGEEESEVEAGEGGQGAADKARNALESLFGQ